MKSEKFFNDIHSKSFELLAEDCETIRTLISFVHDPDFTTNIYSYYTLFCKSAQEFIDIVLSGVDWGQISTSRNTLKLTQKSCKKILNIILEIDHCRDKEFKRDAYMAGLLEEDEDNYCNLGLSFNKTFDVVSNTHMSSFRTNVENLFDNDCGEKSKAKGFDVGTTVRNIYKSIPGQYKRYFCELRNIPHEAYYMDLNTNKQDNFFKNEYKKEINLFFLFMLCDLNFVYKVLLQTLPEGNLWGFRIKYVSAHNACLGFKQIRSQLPKDSKIYDAANNITNLQGKVFKSSFRGCMMHYNLIQDGDSLIQEKYFDDEKPFFGLVESCFEGISFEEYSMQLDKIICDMIEALSDNFIIDHSRLIPYREI